MFEGLGIVAIEAQAAGVPIVCSEGLPPETDITPIYRKLLLRDGAIFNIAMNFILIPQVGVYGAAIATCISYILVFVFRLFHTRKYIQYNINNKEFIVGSTALVLSAGLMFIDNRFVFLLQCVILAATIYLFSDIWLPIVRKILKLKGRR